MYSLWLICAYLMTVVADRGHGGDGAGDPPPGPFGGTGYHKSDSLPCKTRGKAKNTKLVIELAKKGGPMTLAFDRVRLRVCQLENTQTCLPVKWDVGCKRTWLMVGGLGLMFRLQRGMHCDSSIFQVMDKRKKKVTFKLESRDKGSGKLPDVPTETETDDIHEDMTKRNNKRKRVDISKKKDVGKKSKGEGVMKQRKHNKTVDGKSDVKFNTNDTKKTSEKKTCED